MAAAQATRSAAETEQPGLAAGCPDIVDASQIQAPGPVLTFRQQCLFALFGQTAKVESERVELFQSTLDDETLHDGMKSATENTAIIATLVLAFVYDSSQQPMDLSNSWDHPEAPGQFPDDTLWGSSLETGLHVREFVLLLNGFLAALMLMGCVHNIFTLCLIPRCKTREYLELATARVCLVLNPFQMVGAFLLLVVLQVTLTRKAFIGITAVVMFVLWLVYWLLYTGSLNWVHVHLMRCAHHKKQSG